MKYLEFFIFWSAIGLVAFPLIKNHIHQIIENALARKDWESFAGVLSVVLALGPVFWAFFVAAACIELAEMLAQFKNRER